MVLARDNWWSGYGSDDRFKTSYGGYLYNNIDRYSMVGERERTHTTGRFYEDQIYNNIFNGRSSRVGERDTHTTVINSRSYNHIYWTWTTLLQTTSVSADRDTTADQDNQIAS